MGLFIFGYNPTAPKTSNAPNLSKKYAPLLVLQSLNCIILCINIRKNIDDGHTGTNFNRSGIKQLFEAVRRGKASCIIVKDLSRFGRKYLEVSKYLEQLFPYLGVRFIAVGDGYDSDTHKGTTANLDVPIRNMLNALYSKKVSKDVKSAKQSQVQQGKYIHALAPFGYKKTLRTNISLLLMNHQLRL